MAMNDKVLAGRQEVIDYIVTSIQENNTVPWQKSTLFEGNFNPISGTHYKGGNRLRLAISAMKNQFDDPRWVTFKQAKEKGYHLEKGSKGTQIEFYESKIVKPDEKEQQAMTEEEIKKATKHYVVIKTYTVFNASQFSNFPELEVPNKISESDRIKELETIISNSEAPIFFDSPTKQCYIPSLDEIHVAPKNQFNSQEAMYSTVMHEIGHSTGHESRLNRDLSGTFGSEKYAREELRAEFTSVFLNHKYNLEVPQQQLDNNTAYLHSWVKVMQEDPNELFKAVQDAEKAVDYIEAHMLHKEKTAIKEQEQASENMRVPIYYANGNLDRESTDCAYNYNKAFNEILEAEYGKMNRQLMIRYSDNGKGEPVVCRLDPERFNSSSGLEEVISAHKIPDFKSAKEVNTFLKDTLQYTRLSVGEMVDVKELEPTKPIEQKEFTKEIKQNLVNDCLQTYQSTLKGTGISETAIAEKIKATTFTLSKFVKDHNVSDKSLEQVLSPLKEGNEKKYSSEVKSLKKSTKALEKQNTNER